MQNFASWNQLAGRRSASPAASEIALALAVTVSDCDATCEERLDGWAQGVRAKEDPPVRLHGAAAVGALDEEPRDLSVESDLEIVEGAELGLPAPDREAAHRVQRAAAVAVSRRAD